jgi:hypothetical protein
MDAAATVRDYYRALRAGEPLGPYFLDAPTTVKFGIGERLTGHGEVVAGLREQSRTTRGWEVDSRRLVVEERDCHAWFSDDVWLAWTDTERQVRFEFDTRWSGTLERVGDGSDSGDDPAAAGDPTWLFTGMHVSVAGDT